MKTDPYILNTDSNEEINNAVLEFKTRCTTIISKVFSKDIDTVRDFDRWFESYMKITNDPVLMIHEEPLYIVCKYLGFDPLQLTDEARSLAERIAVQEKWNDL